MINQTRGIRVCPLCGKPMEAVWSAEDDSHWECTTGCKMVKIFIEVKE